MRTIRLLPLVALISSLFLTACPENKCSNGENAVLRDLSGIDGCIWVFELENGQLLEPVNLHLTDFEPKDGLKVRIRFTEATDVMSICMTGKMVRIDCIAKR